MMRIKILALLFFFTGLWTTPIFAMDGATGLQLWELEKSAQKLNNSEWILRRHMNQRESIRKEIEEKALDETEYVANLREELQGLRLSYEESGRRAIETLKTLHFGKLIYLSPTPEELREAINSFHWVKNQLSIENPVEHKGPITYLNENAYYASNTLLLVKDRATVDDINLHWLCCNESKKYDEAYDAVTTMMDKHQQPLESFQDHQIDILVNTFSHCTILEPQKQRILENFLIAQGSPTSHIRLLNLYLNRGMWQETAAFCKAKYEDLLKITDESFFFWLQDIVLSCLIAKEYDLSQKFLKAISDPLTALALKAITDVARRDRHEAETSINIFSSTLEQSHDMPTEERDFHLFNLNLLRKDIGEAIQHLKQVKTDKRQSSALIHLKEKTAASPEEIRKLKSQHLKNFGSLYNPSDFKFSNLIIDIVME